jgi:hypothetical protein
LELRRVDDAGDAGLLVCSLPWPRARARALSLDGRSTYNGTLGQWPGTPPSANAAEEAVVAPRRMLLIADGGPAGTAAPQHVKVKAAAGPAPSTAFAVESHVFESSPEPRFFWERSALRLRFGEVTVDLALGLRTAGAVHWWEACRLVVDEQTPAATAVRMAGAIPVQLTCADDLSRNVSYKFPLLHKHNWLSGEIYARVHHNGVVEVFARHINNKYVDEGKSFDDVVPVVGLRVHGQEESLAAWLGEDDGSRARRTLGPVSFDFADAARLATPRQPARFDRQGQWLVWQSCAGVDVFGGVGPLDMNGNAWVTRADERRFPRGMARTLRFSLSCSDRSPRVVRYLPPWWWYHHHQEIRPHSSLPVHDEHDAYLEEARQWSRRHIVDRGFEDGSMPRYVYNVIADGRHEPGWEGEVPHAQFLLAWHSAHPQDYHNALRSAYHFADVVIDHADGLARMHGYAYPPTAFALPMSRGMGILTAWLETGDPYLLHAAEQLVESAHRLHENSWPRLAVGRDACYGRTAVLLYRYTNNQHFRRIGHAIATAVAQSQRPCGSFGDQGGGVGIHAWNGYITKAWMGCLATSCVIDYLDMFPDEPVLRDCILRFADWLMQTRWERDGYVGWSYQHDYNGGSEFYSFQTGQKTPLPSSSPWHQDHLARVLGLASVFTGDTAYIDAYAGSLQTLPAYEIHEITDHAFVATVHGLHWLKHEQWRPTLTNRGVLVSPRWLGERLPRQATIDSPLGPRSIAWGSAGDINVPSDVTVHPAPPWWPASTSAVDDRRPAASKAT